MLYYYLLLLLQNMYKHKINKKETRGGNRPFSGRKKSDYETKTISFRVRLELVEPIKQMVKDYVSDCLQGDA